MAWQSSIWVSHIGIRISLLSRLHIAQKSLFLLAMCTYAALGDSNSICKASESGLMQALRELRVDKGLLTSMKIAKVEPRERLKIEKNGMFNYLLYPVFWMPAAIPFMVRIRVSSSPGGNSVVGFNSTNSAARLGDLGTSLD